MECKYCKAVIEDGVKFCPECGKRAPINESFDARTHRCPYCDTILPSFVQNCPSCGSEIRSEAKVSKVDVFAQKYMQQTTNEQRISLIKTFVIPNTREDILEFVILASTNIDEKVYEKHQTHDEDNLSAEDVSDAWMIKLEQAHQKAHLVLNGDSYLSKIDSIYSQKKNFFTKKR